MSPLSTAGDAIVVPESLLNQVESGNAEAAYFIAITYLDEEGEENHQKGQEWMARAAEMEYPQAMYELGELLDDEDKRTEALHWFTKAMQFGHASALGSVAVYHYFGHGGLDKDSDKDCSTAYDYFQQAAMKEDETALNNYAWFLATSANPKCRVPERALKVFSTLKKKYKDENSSMPWHFQDTESAILAALADFTAAIINQERIIESMEKLGLNTESFKERLAVFQARKPYFEPE